MSRDPFIDKCIRARKKRGLTVEEAAKAMNMSASALRRYEEGRAAPSQAFIDKATKFLCTPASEDHLESLFAQGQFGNKIPLVTEADLMSDCENHIVSYYELPDLAEYGQNNLFALRYTGESVPEKGISENSILVFTRCKRVDRDGVYAVASRNTLKLKQAQLSEGRIKLTPLDNKKRLPQYFTTVSAKGRLVCCINTYK